MHYSVAGGAEVGQPSRRRLLYQLLLSYHTLRIQVLLSLHHVWLRRKHRDQLVLRCAPCEKTAIAKAEALGLFRDDLNVCAKPHSCNEHCACDAGCKNGPFFRHCDPRDHRGSVAAVTGEIRATNITPRSLPTSASAAAW